VTRYRFVLLGLAAMVVATADTEVALAQAGVEADDVIAAFVYRFPQFVEWPESALAGRETVDICVAEPDPFGESLEALVEGEVLNGRPLAVRRVNGAGELEGCHVLFVSSATESQEALLHAVADRPVLTIGESTDFLDDGGIINLRVVDRRIRFEVSATSALRSRLQLSSQLLALALVVHGSLR
jgi:hypothetical protein